jgi:hypothetical protein
VTTFQTPAGVNLIDVVEHFPYNVGAAIDALARAGSTPVVDVDLLELARTLIDREIARVGAKPPSRKRAPVLPASPAQQPAAVTPAAGASDDQMPDF